MESQAGRGLDRQQCQKKTASMIKQAIKEQQPTMRQTTSSRKEYWDIRTIPFEHVWPSRTRRLRWPRHHTSR